VIERLIFLQHTHTRFTKSFFFFFFSLLLLLLKQQRTTRPQPTSQSFLSFSRSAYLRVRQLCLCMRVHVPFERLCVRIVWDFDNKCVCECISRDDKRPIPIFLSFFLSLLLSYNNNNKNNNNNDDHITNGKKKNQNKKKSTSIL
jgi:preprotein translocase subunit SecG